MEDQKLGKRCSVPECRQIDWMPINCKYCHKDFCADHSSIDSHQCTEVAKDFKKVFICPLCEQPISINHNLAVEQNFSIHEAMECSKKPKKVEVKKCLQCKTKLTELNSYKCKQCEELLCPKHRLKEDHKCVSGYNKRWKNM